MSIVSSIQDMVNVFKVVWLLDVAVQCSIFLTISRKPAAAPISRTSGCIQHQQAVAAGPWRWRAQAEEMDHRPADCDGSGGLLAVYNIAETGHWRVLPAIIQPAN